MKNFYSNFVLTLAIMLMTTTGTFAQIIWNGTPVNYNTTQTITQTVNITASTTVTVASGVTVTISGVISGPNSSFTLTKAGAGKLIFTGANTYNCATAVSAGTLQVGNGTSTTATINSTSNVTLANNAILRFEPGRNMQFDRVISGTGGKVEFKGDSEGYKSLELAACNYTGTTTIESGRLTIWCGSDYSAVLGNIINNGELLLDTYDAYSYNGIISGTGSVTHNTMVESPHGHAGCPLTFTGAHTYEGETILHSTLVLASTGSIANSSAVTIDNYYTPFIVMPIPFTFKTNLMLLSNR